jgi:hypothetical protein
MNANRIARVTGENLLADRSGQGNTRRLKIILHGQTKYGYGNNRNEPQK